MGQLILPGTEAKVKLSNQKQRIAMRTFFALCCLYWNGQPIAKARCSPRSTKWNRDEQKPAKRMVAHSIDVHEFTDSTVARYICSGVESIVNTTLYIVMKNSCIPVTQKVELYFL